jgi:PAS domain S-box-containing protein
MPSVAEEENVRLRARIEILERELASHRRRVEVSRGGAAVASSEEGSVDADSGPVSAFRDMSGRSEADERLRRSEELLRESQEIAHVGSWDWDLRTNVVTRSAELYRIYGMSEEELADTVGVAFDRVHPSDRDRVRAAMTAAVEQRRSYALDLRQDRPGEARFLHARGRAVCDASGKAIRLVGTMQDVTAQKHVEARLRQADRMASIGTLAAGVAHEINNPLTYILANLDLVAEQLREMAAGSPSEPLTELTTLVAEAREGGERVRTIVRGLKTLSRAGDEERRVVLDVRSILDVAARLANNEIAPRARLVRDFAEVPLVEADEAKLIQVFVNLLVNATQALPAGRAHDHEIALATRKDEAGRVVVEVRDTGAGMSREVLARVFEPFFTTRPIGLGTGLGLSICHGIITALGGEISARSEPGKGSVFQVALPAAKTLDASPAATAPAVATAGKRGRILIVDDDVLVGKTLSRVLKEHDVTVLTDAREARDRLVGGEHFDLILCDLMMPEMTGMELHAALGRTDPALLDRMIFVTGGAFTSAAAEFLDRVPNERIDKPFDSKKIRDLVQQYLG